MAAPRKRVKKKLSHHLKNHFVPHEGNGYVPHLLKHRFLLAYSGILIATKAALLLVGVAMPSATLYSYAINEGSIVALTNEARSVGGLRPVAVNAKLRSAAQAKADDMVVRQYFSHEGPEGESPWYFLNRSGYRYSTAGENLAIHYQTAEALEQGWLASPTHRANILDKRFTEMGVGFAKGKIEGYESMVVVQIFAMPRTSATADVAVVAPTTTRSIAESSAVLKNEQLEITVKAPEANLVSGHIGDIDIAFVKDPTTGTWIGRVEPKPAESPVQEVYATVHSNESNPETELVALVVPHDQITDLYRTKPKEESRVLGIKIDGLGDHARKFYVGTLVVLFSLLLLNIFVKFHIQHPSIIAHTIAVMGLAIVLVFV